MFARGSSGGRVWARKYKHLIAIHGSVESVRKKNFLSSHLTYWQWALYIRPVCVWSLQFVWIRKIIYRNSWSSNEFICRSQGHMRHNRMRSNGEHKPNAVESRTRIRIENNCCNRLLHEQSSRSQRFWFLFARSRSAYRYSFLLVSFNRDGRRTPMPCATM